jgi:hypothetical protein
MGAFSIRAVFGTVHEKEWCPEPTSTGALPSGKETSA